MDNKNLIKGEKLCKECGLCCEGVFHTFALLNNNVDIDIVKKANIPIQLDQNNHYFSLPCPAFNSICTIYPERPSVCSGYKCDLLNSVIDNETTLEDAHQRVTKMKYLLNDLLSNLKNFNKNRQINNPKILMEKILDSFRDEDSKKEFKKENKNLFINYAIFIFLKKKYFYDKEKNNKT